MSFPEINLTGILNPNKLKQNYLTLDTVLDIERRMITKVKCKQLTTVYTTTK